MQYSIYEINYAAHPGGVDAFAILDPVNGKVLGEYPTLTEAISKIYDKAKVITIYTIKNIEDM